MTFLNAPNKKVETGETFSTHTYLLDVVRMKLGGQQRGFDIIAL